MNNNKIIKHLVDISKGECTITEESVLNNGNTEEQEIELGLLVLFEEIQYNRKSLKKSNKNVALITDNIAEVVYKSIYRENDTFFIEYISPNIQEILGFSQYEYRKNDPKMVSSLKSYALPSARAFNTKIKNATKPQSFTIEYEWFHPIKKEWLWMSETVVPQIANGKAIGQFGTILDITARKLAEKEKYLAVIKTEERERQRLAQDLHDGLGQRIAAANMSINALEDIARSQLDEEALEIFLTTKELIYNATKECRAISHNITPNSMKDFGLERAVGDLVKSYNIINRDINISFNSNLNGDRLSNDNELASFRCIQEAVNNALKHSKSDTIDILIHKSSKYLNIMVSDNGIGFDATNNTKNCQSGIGLKNLKQRIDILGGNLTVKSSPDNGTSIELGFSLLKPKRLLKANPQKLVS